MRTIRPSVRVIQGFACALLVLPAACGGAAAPVFASPATGLTSLVVQPDGKIVAAGWTATSLGRCIAVARYESTGALDASFGAGGAVTTCGPSGGAEAKAVALQSDGKIL